MGGHLCPTEGNPAFHKATMRRHCAVLMWSGRLVPDSVRALVLNQVRRPAGREGGAAWGRGRAEGRFSPSGGHVHPVQEADPCGHRRGLHWAASSPQAAPARCCHWLQRAMYPGAHTKYDCSQQSCPTSFPPATGQLCGSARQSHAEPPSA